MTKKLFKGISELAKEVKPIEEIITEKRLLAFIAGLDYTDQTERKYDSVLYGLDGKLHSIIVTENKEEGSPWGAQTILFKETTNGFKPLSYPETIELLQNYLKH